MDAPAPYIGPERRRDAHGETIRQTIREAMEQESCRQESYRREIREKVDRLAAEHTRSSEEAAGELHRLGIAYAKLAGRLEERCAVRGDALEDVQERLAVLEAVEHRRKGGIAAMCCLLSAAGALGGLVVKLWPFGGH